MHEPVVCVEPNTQFVGHFGMLKYLVALKGGVPEPHVEMKKHTTSKFVQVPSGENESASFTVICHWPAVSRAACTMSGSQNWYSKSMHVGQDEDLVCHDPHVPRPHLHGEGFSSASYSCIYA